MRILIVEDDPKIASFVTKGLQQAGFSTDHATDGEQGLHYALTASYDAAVIDVMLPKLDGLTLIQRLRGQKIHTPIIILSAKRSLEDRIIGLQEGGDDYLTKPFAFSELLARLQALIRRSSGISPPTLLIIADLSLDILKRKVTRSGLEIDLKPREFNLLEYLMRNQSKVISKTMILENIFGYYFDPQTNVVDVLICRLRDKVDRHFDVKLIHTIRGIGYVLRDS